MTSSSDVLTREELAHIGTLIRDGLPLMDGDWKMVETAALQGIEAREERACPDEGPSVEEILRRSVVKGLCIEHERGRSQGLREAAKFLIDNGYTFIPSERSRALFLADELRKLAGQSQ